MILNIALLALIYGAEKKKVSPYLMALIFGLIKGSAYAFYTRDIVTALVIAIIYATLASAFVFFLKRIDRQEDKKRPDVPVYKTPGAEKIKFKWEYIPFSLLGVLLIAGDMMAHFIKIEL